MLLPFVSWLFSVMEAVLILEAFGALPNEKIEPDQGDQKDYAGDETHASIHSMILAGRFFLCILRPNHAHPIPAGSLDRSHPDRRCSSAAGQIVMRMIG